MPHAVFMSPGWHVPFEQQPLHVDGPHAGGLTHWPLLQVWFDRHATHALPTEPHCEVVVPLRHVPPELQHPLQLLGLHEVLVMHAPFTQVCEVHWLPSSGMSVVTWPAGRSG